MKIRSDHKNFKIAQWKNVKIKIDEESLQLRKQQKILWIKLVILKN